jgi:hypothetical protein
MLLLEEEEQEEEEPSSRELFVLKKEQASTTDLEDILQCKLAPGPCTPFQICKKLSIPLPQIDSGWVT